MMNILQQAHKGKIVKVSVNGDGKILDTIPDKISVLHQTRNILLMGNKSAVGPVNKWVKKLTGHNVIGAVVVVAQKPYLQTLRRAAEISEDVRRQRRHDKAVQAQKADDAAEKAQEAITV